MKLFFHLGNSNKIFFSFKCSCRCLSLRVHCQFLSVICFDIASYVRVSNSICTDSIAFFVQFIFLSSFSILSFFITDQKRLPSFPLHCRRLQQAIIYFDAFYQCWRTTASWSNNNNYALLHYSYAIVSFTPSHHAWSKEENNCRAGERSGRTHHQIGSMWTGYSHGFQGLYCIEKTNQ